MLASDIQLQKIRTVLLIDSKDEQARHISELLRQSGFNVKTYNTIDGIEKILPDVKPDVALLDYHTCFLKNPNLLKKLHKYQADLYSIVITDQDTAQDAIRVLREGAYDFICRPFLPENIIIRLTHCFEQKELNQEKNQTKATLLETEQRLARALRSTNDGMWDWEVKSGHVYYSERWKQMLGYDECEIENTFIAWRDLIHPDDLGIALMHWLDQLEGNSEYLDFEYRLLTKHNVYKWIHVRGKGRYDKHGDIEYISGSHADITEKKHALLAREQLETQLRQSHKMKALGQLTAGIAHDFNNILASIMGYAELSKELFASNGKNKLASYLDEISTAGERARELIVQLLAYSRDSGGNDVVLSIIPIVKEVVKLLQSSFPSSVELSISTSEKLSCCMMDPVQMQQIIMNLCLNSKEAMNNKGQIKITLSERKFDSTHKKICDSCHEEFTGDFIIISINDTGQGIDQIVFNKIFDPYVTTKEFGDGPGMGLSVVHGIVHQHHGHISVQSIANQGTSIELYFPINQAIKLPKKNRHNNTENNNVNILIVDDEQPVAEYLGEYLKLHGYTTTVFTSSVEALDFYKNTSTKFGLLITDLTMPNISGLELARACSNITGQLPVIVCSGDQFELNELDEYIPAIKEILPKPFVGSQLLSTVAEVLDINS